MFPGFASWRPTYDKCLTDRASGPLRGLMPLSFDDVSMENVLGVKKLMPFQNYPQCHNKFQWNDHHQVCNICVSPYNNDSV